MPRQQMATDPMICVVSAAAAKDGRAMPAQTTDAVHREGADRVVDLQGVRA